MYKEAAKQKLRFDTPRGILSVEQLFDLSLTDLTTTIKKVNEIVKKENAVDNDLAFLENDNMVESQNVLRFKILKDIYMTRKEEREADKLAADKKKRREYIAGLIAQKKDEELKGKSIEELEKMLNE